MTEPCADVRADIATFGPFRGGIYNILRARWVSGKRNRLAEVYVSPTGRSVSVYVDGKRYVPAVPQEDQ